MSYCTFIVYHFLFSEKNSCKHLQVEHFIQCFEDYIKTWKNGKLSVSAAGFLLRFIGIFARSELGFKTLLEKNIPQELLSCVNFEVFQSSPFKISYITLLSDLINHDQGYTWVKEHKYWKSVIKMFLSSSSIYADREGERN